MMAQSSHDKHDEVAGAKKTVAIAVAFDEASCANPVRWASTATETWRCPCCGEWIAPSQTHRCISHIRTP